MTSAKWWAALSSLSSKGRVEKSQTTHNFKEAAQPNELQMPRKKGGHDREEEVGIEKVIHADSDKGTT